MTSHLRVLIRSVAVASSALMAVGLASLAAAQAATAAGSPPPGACTTFTVKSADALFGVGGGTHLTEHPKNHGTGSNETSVCTIEHDKTTLTVTTTKYPTGFGGPYKCYARPKLGSDADVCVGTMKADPGTFAIYKKGTVYFSDDFSKTLPDQGKALYTFALAQSKAYKG